MVPYFSKDLSFFPQQVFDLKFSIYANTIMNMLLQEGTFLSTKLTLPLYKMVDNLLVMVQPRRLCGYRLEEDLLLWRENALVGLCGVWPPEVGFKHSPCAALLVLRFL